MSQIGQKVLQRAKEAPAVLAVTGILGAAGAGIHIGAEQGFKAMGLIPPEAKVQPVIPDSMPRPLLKEKQRDSNRDLH